MNFKDKAYYVNKAKYYLGLALTVISIDAFIAFMIMSA
jgi:hypothetical protein